MCLCAACSLKTCKTLEYVQYRVRFVCCFFLKLAVSDPFSKVVYLFAAPNCFSPHEICQCRQMLFVAFNIVHRFGIRMYSMCAVKPLADLLRRCPTKAECTQRGNHAPIVCSESSFLIAWLAHGFMLQLKIPGLNT